MDLLNKIVAMNPEQETLLAGTSILSDFERYRLLENKSCNSRGRST